MVVHNIQRASFTPSMKLLILYFIRWVPFASKAEQFHEARLVRITHRGFAICLDPFGMLEPQVVVNLLPKLGIGVDFVRYSR